MPKLRRMFLYGYCFHHADHGRGIRPYASRHCPDARNCTGIKAGCLWCRKTADEVSRKRYQGKGYRYHEELWERYYGTCCHQRFYQCHYAYSGYCPWIWLWSRCRDLWPYAQRCSLSPEYPSIRWLASSVFLLCRRCSKSHGRDQGYAALRRYDCYRQDLRWKPGRIKEEWLLWALWWAA